MKIVFAASEAADFLKTGGLGDVAGALPKALSEEKGNEVILFIPYYKQIKENREIKTAFVKSFAVDLSWRKQHVGIFKLISRKKKLKIFFVDNEYYFGRDGVYGYGDDGERFAYFSKAILQALCILKIRPDVIHCNDWQTALIPVFLHSFYSDYLGGVKTVFTIHNIEYQGKADPPFIGDTLGLSDDMKDILTFDGNVNFMKAAILKCDALTTVSETYADEIRYPYFAHGLDGVIRDHAFKLSGIVNGISTEHFDPQTDPDIYANYCFESFTEGKAKNKKMLRSKLGMEQSPSALVGMVSRIVSHKGFDLVCAAAEQLLSYGVQLVIVGTGEYDYEERLKACAARHKGQLSLNLCFDVKLASQIYAASDIYLMPSKSEPCGLSQLIAMRYGAVPVVNETGGLKDTVEPFNPVEKTGVGFTFETFNCDDMLSAVRRALEIYNDENVWRTVVKNAMTHDLSWKKSAAKYTELYHNLTEAK